MLMEIFATHWQAAFPLATNLRLHEEWRAKILTRLVSIAHGTRFRFAQKFSV